MPDRDPQLEHEPIPPATADDVRAYREKILDLDQRLRQATRAADDAHDRADLLSHALEKVRRERDSLARRIGVRHKELTHAQAVAEAHYRSFEMAFLMRLELADAATELVAAVALLEVGTDSPVRTAWTKVREVLAKIPDGYFRDDFTPETRVALTEAGREFASVPRATREEDSKSDSDVDALSGTRVQTCACNSPERFKAHHKCHYGVPEMERRSEYRSHLNCAHDPRSAMADPDEEIICSSGLDTAGGDA